MIINYVHFDTFTNNGHLWTCPPPSADRSRVNSEKRRLKRDMFEVMSELFSFGDSNQESMGDALTIQVKILNRAVKNLKLNFIRDAQILKQNRKGIWNR